MTGKLNFARLTTILTLVALPGCDRAGSSAKGEPATAANAASDTSAPMKTLVAGPSEAISRDCSQVTFAPESIEITIDKKSLKKLGGNDQTFPRKIERVMGGSKQPDNNRPNIDPYSWPTNVDFEVKQPAGSTEFTKVTVYLEKGNQDDVEFLRILDSNGIPSSTDSTYAITAQSGKSDQFCLVKTFGGTGSVVNVTFGVQIPKDETTSFNIGLIIYDKKGSRDAGKDIWVPIYIDPNVKNEG